MVLYHTEDKMAANDNRKSRPIGPERVVAVFTRDEVLAVDIEQALRTIGCRAWVAYSRDFDRALSIHSGRVDAAIVDLQFLDDGARHFMAWLTKRKIPVIALSVDGTVPPDVPQSPKIVRRFSKPLCVDRILPSVVAAVRS